MSCVTSSVAPPGTAVWYDLAATTDDALALLRLTEADVDAARIATLVPVEARSMDIEFDRLEAIVGPPPPPEVQEELVQRVAEAYQMKPPNQSGFTAPPVRNRAYRAHKQRWGVS